MKRDDTLWKAILEDIFDDFLRFFYEDADAIFDFSKGFEFLDKELDDLFPREESESIKYVDKLVKVHLRDGAEKWILVHIEVQGYKDKTFEERMFTYYYRIKDRYQRDITAWAILTDSDRKNNPSQYSNAYLGTELIYRFNTYKVLIQDEEQLRLSDNPFASVILTVLLALKKGKITPDKMIELKLDLVRNLLKKGFEKNKIRAIMNFLQYYIRFNQQNTSIFEQELDKITGKTHPMGIEQFLLDRATTKGEKKGIEKGIEKGVIKANTIAILNGFDNGLTVSMICNINELTEEFVHSILRKHGRIG